MLVGIVVPDGVLSSGFTSVHDTLSVAEALRVKHDLTIPEIRVLVAGEQPIVRRASGLAIPTTARPDQLMPLTSSWCRRSEPATSTRCRPLGAPTSDG